MEPPPAIKSQGMTFAEKQLQRHGWTEGKGLGRRENGISEAIKVKVKCDTAGVGHNSAEQFTFHWWDHVFNKTASSISVESDQDGVQVKKVTEDETPVTNKKPRKALTNRDMLYGRFIKSATLLSGGETPVEKESSSETSDSSEDEDEKLDLSSATKLTDEDLVKICGGRTAHKGARHGLTMSAKLLRIEEQERAFLEKYRKKERKDELIKPKDESSSVKTKKKKAHNQEATDEATQDHSPDGRLVKKEKMSSDAEDVINGRDKEKTKQKDRTSKKKRPVDNVELKDVNGLDEHVTTSENKKVLEEMTDELGDHVQFTEDDLKGSKKKKKKKKAADDLDHDLEDQASSVEDQPPRKKKKKRKVTDDEDERIEEPLSGHQEMLPLEDSQTSPKKKRKHVNLNGVGEQEADDSTEKSKDKKKRKKENIVLEAEEYIEEENTEDLKKKKKKKSKSKHSDPSLEETVDNTECHIKRKKKRKDES